MYKFVKRFFDVFSSLIALIVFFPLLLVVSMLIRINLGSPIFFKQERPGENEKLFTLIKFRTMTDEKDENGNYLPDDKRLTGLGKFLRATSIDELPELINILKGDMSVIGPRPLLVRYLPRYNEHQRKRHNVKPGLTGLAQISGRNAISWQERFDLDVEYVEKISFKLDVKILFKTVLKVFKRDGISSHTSATMEEFMGNVEE